MGQRLIDAISTISNRRFQYDELLWYVTRRESSAIIKHVAAIYEMAADVSQHQAISARNGVWPRRRVAIADNKVIMQRLLPRAPQLKACWPRDGIAGILEASQAI